MSDSERLEIFIKNFPVCHFHIIIFPFSFFLSDFFFVYKMQIVWPHFAFLKKLPLRLFFLSPAFFSLRIFYGHLYIVMQGPFLPRGGGNCFSLTTFYFSQCLFFVKTIYYSFLSSALFSFALVWFGFSIWSQSLRHTKQALYHEATCPVLAIVSLIDLQLPSTAHYRGRPWIISFQWKWFCCHSPCLRTKRDEFRKFHKERSE